MTPRLPSVDWALLLDAYGPATDAPAQLAKLLAANTCNAGLEYLSSSIVHQSSLYPATAPVLRWVCDLLGSPPSWWGPQQMSAVIDWVGDVADSITMMWEPHVSELAASAQVEPADEADFQALLQRLDGSDDDSYLLHPAFEPLMFRAVVDLIACEPTVAGALVPLLDNPQVRPDVETALHSWAAVGRMGSSQAL